MKLKYLRSTPIIFILAATCTFGLLFCAGCSSGSLESDSDITAVNSEVSATESTNEQSLNSSSGRTILLPDWYFNNTSDEDVIEILINAGCTNAERSGDNFAVTMPEAYAEAFVVGMKGEVQEIYDGLAEEATTLGATLETDEDFTTITLTIPDEAYATENGSNLALNAKAAAAAAYIYRSAADLGTCNAVILNESGTELDTATLPDDHEELLNTAKS